jgi:hypothetical protein
MGDAGISPRGWLLGAQRWHRAGMTAGALLELDFCGLGAFRGRKAPRPQMSPWRRPEDRLTSTVAFAVSQTTGIA